MLTPPGVETSVSRIRAICYSTGTTKELCVCKSVMDDIVSVNIDTLIVGGGIAGLWLLDELRQRGRSAVLVEAHALGTGQTISSQGILHSGLKYSLQGLLTSAAREAREMPLLWRRCLAGEAQPDLRNTRISADSFLLWGTDSLASKVGLLGAKMGLRVTPQSVPQAERPACLQDCSGTVYRVAEQVISPASILQSFLDQHRPSILHCAATDGIQFQTASPGQIVTATIRSPSDDQTLEFLPQSVVLCAGAGNESLRTQAGLTTPAMQRRPLHMVLIRGDLPEFYGHCVDGAQTRVSITSARDRAGRIVWQVGGQISEDGVGLDPAALIRLTQQELRAVLPSLNLSGTEWSTYRVDRAEGRTLTGARPDSFKIHREGNVTTVWPTKLVLAPLVAQTLAETLCQAPATVASDPATWQDWPRPEVAQPIWDRSEQVWHSESSLTRTTAVA